MVDFVVQHQVQVVLAGRPQKVAQLQRTVLGFVRSNNPSHFTDQGQSIMHLRQR